MKPEKRKEVFAKTNGFCWYCGEDISFDNFQVDHVKPQIDGKDHRIENLVPSCKVCNVIKNRSTTLSHLRDCLGRRKLGNVHFSPSQIKYLAKFGIDLPKRPVFQFYFERVVSHEG